MPVCKDENAEKERRRKIGEAVRNAAIRRRKVAGLPPMSRGPFKCETCGKEIKTDSRRCHSCATTALRAREKENKDKLCEICGKPSGRKICWDCQGKKCSDTWKRKIAAREGKEPPKICDACGGPIWEKYCVRCKNAKSIRLAGKAAMAKFPLRKQTRIEKLVSEVLDSLGIDYEKEYRIGNRFFDLYIPVFNTLIEVDGEYWHSLPNVKAAEKIKDALAESKGFRLVRLSEELVKRSDFKELAPMYILPLQ